MQGRECQHALFSARYPPTINDRRGIFLVEYMIAVVIGVSLLLFAFEIYQSMKKNHRFTEQVSQMISDSEILTSLIKREINLAGKMGCEVLTSEHKPYDNKTQQFVNFYPLVLQGNALRVVHTQSDYVLLLQAVTQQAFFDVSSYLALHVGDWIVLSDCVNTEFARVVALQSLSDHTQRIWVDHALHFYFKQQTRVSKLAIIEVSFQHSKTKRAVFLSVNGLKTPIVEHVTMLSFQQVAPKSVAFQFELVIGNMKKMGHGYANTH